MVQHGERIGLTVWNSTTGDRLVNIADYYMLHCNEGRSVEYVVGCVEDKASHTILAIGGDQEGNCYLLSVEHPEVVVATWKGHQVGESMNVHS